MAEQAFIDSNIIIFANIKNSPEHIQSLEILKNALKGNFIGYIDTIIAIETHFKLLKKISASEANYRLNTLLNSRRLRFYNITKNTLKTAFKIAEENNIATNDSIIISSMLENDVHLIYTDNEKHFQKFSKIKAINPLRL